MVLVDGPRREAACGGHMSASSVAAGDKAGQRRDGTAVQAAQSPFAAECSVSNLNISCQSPFFLLMIKSGGSRPTAAQVA